MAKKYDNIKEVPAGAWPHDVDASAIKPVSRMNNGGVILNILGGLGVIAGILLDITIADRTPDTGGERAADVGMYTAYGIGMVGHGVGVPLQLLAHRQVRKALGLKPSTGANIAGWVLYGVTAALQPFSFWADKGLYFSVGMFFPWIASFTIAAFESARTIRGLKKLVDVCRMRGLISVAPFVSPVRGGAIAGIGGYF